MDKAYESSLELDETKVTPESDILDLEALKVLLVSVDLIRVLFRLHRSHRTP